jgi:hypothetical protein
LNNVDLPTLGLPMIVTNLSFRRDTETSTNVGDTVAICST